MTTKTDIENKIMQSGGNVRDALELALDEIAQLEAENAGLNTEIYRLRTANDRIRAANRDLLDQLVALEQPTADDLAEASDELDHRQGPGDPLGL